MGKNIKIAPSILTADFTKIKDEIKSLEDAGADYIHLDVMDGVFVPNITFGIKMVEDIRKITTLPLDCHLMIVHPERYVEKFAKAGADYITVHYEATKRKLKKCLKQIKSFGVKCGLVINPDTPVKKIRKYIPLCDMVLVMSVYPGFGGQKFIGDVLQKCDEIRKIIDKENLKCLLEIDGGINENTCVLAKSSGCDVLVAGNVIFKSEDRKKTIKKLREN